MALKKNNALYKPTIVYNVQYFIKEIFIFICIL